jgi:hypothetical protein
MKLVIADSSELRQWQFLVVAMRYVYVLRVLGATCYMCYMYDV